MKERRGGRRPGSGRPRKIPEEVKDMDRFMESMRRVKEGATNPGERNRRGCRFPHCGCDEPWVKCDAKFNQIGGK